MNNLFNNNVSRMIDYLWKIAKDKETIDSNQDDYNGYYSYKRGIKQYSLILKNEGRNTFYNRQKYLKNKQRDNSADRSRSYSSDINENRKYQSYPMKQRGFIALKNICFSFDTYGRGYPPYYPSQMM